MSNVETPIPLPTHNATDDAVGPMLIPLPSAPNARKKNLKLVEEFERDGFNVQVYSYKVTNYGYTITPPNPPTSNPE